MPRQINKKIYVFFLIFFALGTITNKNFPELNFLSESNLTIIDQSEINENEIIQALSFLRDENLFLLKKEEVLDIINSYPSVENFIVFKNYPSNMKINIKRTNYLAITQKDGMNFYLGSNGKLIKIKQKQKQNHIPFIFGNLHIPDFFKIKKIINRSNFDYKDIKNFYYFKNKRWDIETKNGLIIKLPSKNLEFAFETLLNILQNDEFINIKEIDLRQNNQIILNE